MVVTCSRDCVFSLHDCRLCEGISQNWFIPSVNNIDTGTGVIPFPIRVGCADEAYTGAADDLLKANLSGTPLENLTVDQIKSLSESGWDKLGITAQDILKVVGDLPKDTQIREIENSMLPQFLKDALLENNNTAIYEELDVTTFPEYVAAYISRMLLNVVSFLVTFLIAIILVSALMYAVNIIGELPLLGAINHLAGGVLGIGLGFIIVWIAFLVLTLIYTTEIGTTCYAMVEQSAILTFLYNHNPLLIWLLGFR